MQYSARNLVNSVLLFLLLLIANSADARGSRVALVVGNSDYPASPLQNPVNDAGDIASRLKQLNFTVIQIKNATHIQMEQGVRQFGDLLSQNKGIGIFFYAGHGVQVNGRNYLIPIDADIYDETEVKHKALDVDFVLGKMELAGNDVNLLILDACRNNPFERRFRSMTSRGLAPMNAPSGTVIWYATRPGKVAMDGRGRNSPFTRYLLSTLQNESIEARKIISQIAVGMRDEGLQQEPWQEGIWLEDFYFTKPARKTSDIKIEKNNTKDEEQMHWSVIKDMQQANVFEDYLVKCQQPEFSCRHESEARAKLALLQQPVVEEKPISQQAKQDINIELKDIFKSGLLAGAQEINLRNAENVATKLGGGWECKWKATHTKVMDTVVQLKVDQVSGRSFKLKQSQASPLCANALSAKGKFNSKNISPNINPPVHVPLEAIIDQSVDVIVNVSSNYGVRDVILSFSTNNNWINITMNQIDQNTFSATIPGMPDQTPVKYRIIAYDNLDNVEVNDNLGVYYNYNVIPEFSALMFFVILFIISSLVILSKKYTTSKLGCESHLPNYNKKLGFLDLTKNYPCDITS